MKYFAVAIDGPAGAGKSSVAKEVAKALNANYLDTGAMYRAFGLYMLRCAVDIDDMEMVAARADEPDVRVKYVDGVQVTCLGEEDVSSEIREAMCSKAASAVSRVPEVRERLVALQQGIARENPLVMDGRDIGTHVLPDAPVKIFLTASAEVRAKRRYDELIGKGQEADYDTVLKDIIARDHQDMNRAASPLRKADDAVEVDSSYMTKEEVIAKITEIARAAV